MIEIQCGRCLVVTTGRIVMCWTVVPTTLLGTIPTLIYWWWVQIYLNWFIYVTLWHLYWLPFSILAFSRFEWPFLPAFQGLLALFSCYGLCNICLCLCSCSFTLLGVCGFLDSGFVVWGWHGWGVVRQAYGVLNRTTGLSLHFESTAALFLTPVANLFL